MVHFLIKTFVSAFIIALASELSKRNQIIAAVLLSLPLTSILAFIWIYQESHDIAKISELSVSIFWLVIPSLIFFLVFPLLLKQNINFYVSLLGAFMVMFGGYGILIMLKKYVGML